MTRSLTRQVGSCALTPAGWSFTLGQMRTGTFATCDPDYAVPERSALALGVAVTAL